MTGDRYLQVSSRIQPGRLGAGRLGRAGTGGGAASEKGNDRTVQACP